MMSYAVLKSLQSFTDPISPEHSSYSDRQERIASGPDNGRTIIRTHKAAARSLIGLRVLVQNRRKDKEPILVYGSRVQVVGFPSLTSNLLGGTSEGDNIAKFTKDRCDVSRQIVRQSQYRQLPQ